MRLLILGTGRMANTHAKAFAAMPGVDIVGAVDTQPEALAAFCATYGVGRSFPSLDAALDWGGFDAIDNITPDAIHHPTTLAAIAAGKHVLCEKPLATSWEKAMEMVDAAEAAGRINMVNLSYRNVAELHAARAIIASGEIGTVKHIEASYLQHWLALRDFADEANLSPTWLWRLSRSHGSNGTLGDIGIHILDLVTYATGLDIVAMNSRLQTFRKIEGDRIGDFVFDAHDSFIISAEFANGAIGVIHSTRWAPGHSNDQRLRVYGERGAVELSHGHWGTLLRVCSGEDRLNAVWREVKAEPVPTNYQRFADAVHCGVNAEPSFRHAARLQRLLDLGLRADLEGRPEHRISQG